MDMRNRPVTIPPTSKKTKKEERTSTSVREHLNSPVVARNVQRQKTKRCRTTGTAPLNLNQDGATQIDRLRNRSNLRERRTAKKSKMPEKILVSVNKLSRTETSSFAFDGWLPNRWSVLKKNSFRGSHRSVTA
jgi:hypothetical protein